MWGVEKVWYRAQSDSIFWAIWVRQFFCKCTDPAEIQPISWCLRKWADTSLSFCAPTTEGNFQPRKRLLENQRHFCNPGLKVSDELAAGAYGCTSCKAGTYSTSSGKSYYAFTKVAYASGGHKNIFCELVNTIVSAHSIDSCVSLYIALINLCQ